MIRVPMAYPEHMKHRKPSLSFPCWLTSSCRRRIHAIALSVNCVSLSIGSEEYYSKEPLQKDENTMLRHVIVSLNDDDVATFRKKLEEFDIKYENHRHGASQSRTSSTRQYQPRNYNKAPPPLSRQPPYKQQQTSVYSSELLSLSQIVEIHRKYY